MSDIAPYCGFSRVVHNGHPELAAGTVHCLISGPTEAGKTRGILAPSAVMWGGPAVCVSSKDDLMWLVSSKRWGPKQVIDLRPHYSAQYPVDAQVRSFDPTTLISTPDEAVTAANTMMQMAAVGFGSGADQVSDGGVWEANAETPLSAMLYAASPRGNGEGMTWVLHAVDNVRKPAPPKEGQPPPEPVGPGWWMAAQSAAIREIPLFRNALLRTLDMDRRQRDSIALTMRKSVSPWMRLVLRGITAPAFDPTFLDDPDATLFVLAPAKGSIAGAAVTLLDQLVDRWRAKTTRKEMFYRLLLCCDETANIAPMPALRHYVSEGRGLAVNLMVAVQSTSQLDTVYGRAYADELRDTFPSALILYGAAEEHMLRRGEMWSRETTRGQETYDQATGGKTLSTHTGSSIDYRRLLPESIGYGRLLRRGTAGIGVELPDWPEFLSRYSSTVDWLLQHGDPKAEPKTLWDWVVQRHRRALKASRK
jgi:Type IV secretory system Conjugative DNA transfer